MKVIISVRLLIFTLLSIIILVTFYACATVKTGDKGSKRIHPVEVIGLPICSGCHIGREWLDHTADFSSRHKYYASQKIQICKMCHEMTFCFDCHAHKEEIKPSDKYRNLPEGVFPHRGDYITQHKIDGRIKPFLCAKCHARYNNERCRPCHR